MNVIKDILVSLTNPKTLAPFSFCLAVGCIALAILGHPSALGYIFGTLGFLAMFPAIFADKFAKALAKKLDQ